MKYKSQILTCLTVFLFVFGSSAHAAIQLSGVYDPTGDNNDVDQSGTFASGTGGGSAANVLDLATFKSLVANAFTAGTGGVLSFDGASDTLDSTTAFTSSSFGNGVTVTFNTSSASSGITATTSGGRVPTSGTHALSRSSSPDFDFNSIVVNGGTYGITHFGATLIHRQDAQNWTVSATFSGGGTVTFNAITFASTDTSNTKDTFFGIVAPAGETITRVFFNGDSGHYTYLDDIAFIAVNLSKPTISLVILH